MNIPEATDWHKGTSEGREGQTWHKHGFSWPILAIIVLTGTLCLGLGLEIHKENAAPKDTLWIEQLPQSVLPGSFATSSQPEAGGGAENTSVSEQAAVQPAAVGAASAAAKSVVKPVAKESMPIPTPVPATQAHTYVASKTGKKYYLPTCAGAKRIKEENKIWFATREQAAAAGYSPAAKCKGI
jgi:hypothetical protein